MMPSRFYVQGALCTPHSFNGTLHPRQQLLRGIRAWVVLEPHFVDNS